MPPSTGISNSVSFKIYQLITKCKDMFFYQKNVSFLHNLKDLTRKSKKCLTIMNYSFFLLFVGMFHAIASVSYSQTTQLTLDMHDVTVAQAILQIENASQFYFTYNTSEINPNRKVSVHLQENDIHAVMKQLFAGENVSYIIADKHVVLYKDSEKMYHSNVLQQGINITGTVTDDKGEPLLGVSIVIKGTSQGTVTNNNGAFTLQVPNENASLVFSFVGFVTQEILVGNQRTIKVKLDEDTREIEEVVVVGYGTLKKSDLTGSVGQLQASTLANQTPRHIDQALTGQIAGVQVISKSGMPGESPVIHVRGVGSITAGSEPLYVVDGFPTDNIQTLNPSDIESVDILKDASSTAIYGSRGSNGVIIINTKRGVAGKPTITADVSFGLSKVYDIPRMMNGPELADYAYWSVRNRTLDRGGSVDNPDPTKWLTALPLPQWKVITGEHVVDCDMVREILRTAPEVRYMLGVNGGSENVKYAISAEYLNQDGVVRNSNFDRVSLRANIDVNLSKRASMRFSFSPTFTNENMSYESSSDNYGSYMSSSPVNRAQLWPSYFPARDENGEYFMFSHTDASQEWNPLAQVNEVLNNRKRARMFGNLDFDYKIFDDLRFKIMLGGTVFNSTTSRFEPRLPVFSSGGDYYNIAFGQDESSMGVNWITEYTLHYNKSFKKHNIQGLAGFTAQANWGKSSSLESNRYPNNLIPYLSAVAGILSNGTANVNEWSLVSYLARINYNYDSKYYLTASWRADGSSRFGQDSKYGYFPSIALSWRISKENFLKDVSFIYDLKLRAGYGSTGNNNIGNYNHIATISYIRTVLGGGTVEGYAPARLDNPLLTWEVQKSWNAAVDINLFTNRLVLTFDYYRTWNTDLLLDVNIPATTGFTRTNKNIGEVENRGLDIQVKTINILKRDFNWSTDFNISFNKNEVIKLGPEGDPIRSSTHITQIGQPIGMLYGYQVDGVFMNQAEVDKGPLFASGTTNQSRPGDLRFKDISGPDGKPDDVINSFDQGIMGNPYPDFYYGMTNNVSWKNLSLSVSFYGSYGNDILNLAGVGTLNKRGNRVGQMATQLNFWKTEAEPGDGKTPRPNDTSTGGNREISQHLMDTGSFLRINNLRLNYTVPVETIRKLTNVNSLRVQVYFNITNLYTFTNNETCFNPDISNSRSALTPGVSFSDYPLPRTYVLGVNVKF